MLGSCDRVSAAVRRDVRGIDMVFVDRRRAEPLLYGYVEGCVDQYEIGFCPQHACFGRGFGIVAVVSGDGVELEGCGARGCGGGVER